MKDGYGAGLLMREKDGRYYAATGSKGYRWMESEMVKELGKEDGIDRSYYDKLVDEAVKLFRNTVTSSGLCLMIRTFQSLAQMTLM